MLSFLRNNFAVKCKLPQFLNELKWKRKEGEEKNERQQMYTFGSVTLCSMLLSGFCFNCKPNYILLLNDSNEC